MSGLGLYRAASGLFEPFAPTVLKRRAARGKEDLARLPERLGRAGRPRPPGPLVWLHGVSVGESVSLLPLVDRIRAERPDLALLVTSGTVTSASLLAKRLPPGVIHQYASVDAPGAVRRFLDHWRPSAALFAESELWPNLLLGAKARGVRLGLVSARITEHTARGWGRRRAAARTLLSAFDLVLPQDPASAERLASLGAVVGPQLNLKTLAAPLPCDEAELARLRAVIGARPVVVGASTHDGEEELIAAACPAEALLVLAVRHPERGPAVAARLGGVLRSRGEPLTDKASVYVADTLGEMGLWFRLADLVVMGGAFREGIGGHNPLEPARLGCAIVSGPHGFNFAETYAALVARDGAVISAAETLPQVLPALLADAERRDALARAALAYAEDQAQAFEDGWPLIRALLP